MKNTVEGKVVTFKRLVYKLISQDIETYTFTDGTGLPLSGVSIALKDKDDNDLDWIEHDTTRDKEVTGTIETTPRTTDVNGLVNTYYVEAYTITLNPTNTIAATYCDNVIYTNKYPITITLSKAGYQDYSIILDTLLEVTNLLIKYEKTVGFTIYNGVTLDEYPAQIKLLP